MSLCDAHLSLPVRNMFPKNKPMYFIHEHLGVEQLPDFPTSMSYASQPGHPWVHRGTCTKAPSQRSVSTAFVANTIQKNYRPPSSPLCAKMVSFLALKFDNLVLKTHFTLTYFDPVKH